MGPIDYTSQTKNPFQAALQGMQLGAGIQGIQAQQREEAFKAQQQQAALQQQQALMQQAQNAELARRKFFSNPNPTMRDAAELASFIPESQAKAMQPYLEGMSKEQQQGTLKFNTEVLSALQNNPTVAIQLLRKRAEGEKNSGDPEEAALYERLADSAEKDGPAMAFKGLSSIVSALPGAKEMFEAAGKFGDEQRAAALQPFKLREQTADTIIKEVQAKFAPEKLGADLGLTQAQINQAKASAAASNAAAAKSGAEAKRALAEAGQISSGIIPSDKRPEAEAKFRKEYSEQTKGYQDIKSAYGRILSSNDSAVGDLSLIFGYMKMLDPGSVVREGEFATAQNAAGVPDRIQNIYNKVMSGERLSESQRKSFKGQAGRLYETAQTQEKTVRKGIERMANGYGLSPANIFYEASDTPPSEPVAKPNDSGKGKGKPLNIQVDF
jgi:hypothetical protein